MKKILLIDDSIIQIRLMEGLLKNKYEVIASTSGMKGVDLAKANLPDLIFLDYDMPIIDGRSTLRLLKENNDTMNIPVIFLTGVNDKEHIQQVLKLHPAGYLLKPAKPERLYESIRNILGE